MRHRRLPRRDRVRGRARHPPALLPVREVKPQRRETGRVQRISETGQKRMVHPRARPVRHDDGCAPRYLGPLRRDGRSAVRPRDSEVHDRSADQALSFLSAVAPDSESESEDSGAAASWADSAETAASTRSP